MRLLLCFTLLAAVALPASAAPRRRATHRRTPQHVLSQAGVDRLLGIDAKKEGEKVRNREEDFQYRAATEGLRAPLPLQPQFTDVQRFILAMAAGQLGAGYTPDDFIITGARLRGPGSSDLVITVASEWRLLPHDLRLYGARSLWDIWASIHTPNDPDHSRISIIDSTGRSVGGSSSVLPGSMVYVD